MTLHKSIGTLHYERTAGSFKLIVSVDPGIYLFYRSLIPKYHTAYPQRYAPHISVVRKEVPQDPSAWGKHEGEQVEFLYDPDIQRDARYWWMNVFSTQLEEIRKELGLPVTSPYTLPPSGFEKCFHMTLGNRKIT